MNKLSIAVLSLLAASHGWASTVLFDFNEDPALNGSLTNYGNALWMGFGGVGSATNGYDGWLEITSAAKSQRSAIVFKDFDEGAVVQGFTFECDLRIGNGTTDPADGFSISYARAGDPALVALNPATDGGIWATGPNCEANLPEEGTQTGISIGFDAWDSGGASPPCNVVPGIVKDIIGVSVRVDGTLVHQFATPVKNGTCAQADSLQTGPRDGSNLPDNLCWAHLKVSLSTDAKLNVWWKGQQILTDYQTTYFPSPGRLVLAGRTGDAFQNQDVDNIQITTIPAALALVNQASSYPDGFGVTINDSGASVVNTTTVTAKLNNTAVTPLSVSKSGQVTTVAYHGFPQVLPIGSTNTVEITAKDTNGNTITATRTFVVGSYSTLPASDIVASGVDTTKAGFRLRPWQSGAQPNALYWTEEQLLGLHGANEANVSAATDNGYIDHTGVINFNITPASNGGGDAGNFQTGGGYPDSLFPGIPGANGLNGSTAIEVLTFLKFAAPGLYQMGVNSDDGFRVTEGANPKDRFALNLGQFNGGRGASDTTFYIVVPTAGIYPLRLIWENGNGESGNGANCEWFTLKDGVKYLINDPATAAASGVTAYYAGPALPAYVSHLFPYQGATSARADKLVAQLTDGSTTVNGSSVKLYVDGAFVNATTAKAGAVTTVTADFTLATLMQPGLRTAAIAWQETGGATHSNAWTFTVAKWVILDAGLSVPLSAADATAPGMTLQVAQLDPEIARPGKDDGLPNQMDAMNALLGGLYFPYYGSSTVDTSGVYGPAPVSGNIWNWEGPMDFNVTGNSGDAGSFTYDALLPGIPGVTGKNIDIAAWMKGYAALQAGFYRMGISSDDGFRVSEGTGLTRQVLHVSGSNVDRDVAAVVTTTNNSSFGGTLPVVPISAPAVYLGKAASCPMAATNLTGKVAVINNFNCADADLCYQAASFGAVAVILINDGGWGLPYVLTGTPAGPVHVPVLCVNGFAGEEDMWITNSNIQVTIGADAQLRIGEDDRGKGMSWTDFNFVVPQAALYPLHVLYENRDGGAGFEWAKADSASLAYDDVTRVLVNDSAVAGSIKTYRAVTVQPAPTLRLAAENGITKIYYTGSLRASATVNGTYQAVPGATSPYTVPTGTGQSMFYRSSN